MQPTCAAVLTKVSDTLSVKMIVDDGVPSRLLRQV
jgi:hypothetical protein